QLAWHLGAAQSDIAFLEAENIDWEHNFISFARKKTGSIAIMRFDEDVSDVTSVELSAHLQVNYPANSRVYSASIRVMDG
ncbi:MAG TPA: hypothetical protein VFV96_09860, partial [Verrucomicrobiae bacterium]|nr:hypothetical protein [Verrucomicrobiae bacterium]